MGVSKLNGDLDEEETEGDEQIEKQRKREEGGKIHGDNIE